MAHIGAFVICHWSRLVLTISFQMKVKKCHFDQISLVFVMYLGWRIFMQMAFRNETLKWRKSSRQKLCYFPSQRPNSLHFGVQFRFLLLKYHLFYNVFGPPLNGHFGPLFWRSRINKKHDFKYTVKTNETSQKRHFYDPILGELVEISRDQ